MKCKEVIYNLSILGHYNWHIHTNFSSCAKAEMNLSNILTVAKNAGLKKIALVDHHHRREDNILMNLAKLKNELNNSSQGKLKVVLGAELSAFGIGKYSDSIETNRKIEYRLYACNHYHLKFWEHPTTKTPRAYAEHSLAILTNLLSAQRADCIAHPFLGKYLKDKLPNPTLVTKSITDNELADILELGKNNDVAWELNPSLLSDPEFTKRYWNIGREVKVCFHLGTDAHQLLKIDTKPFINNLKLILGNS